MEVIIFQILNCLCRRGKVESPDSPSIFRHEDLTEHASSSMVVKSTATPLLPSLPLLIPQKMIVIDN